MNRRNFLSLAALAIAGKASERVFPFRVYSIPKEIVVAANPLDTYFLSTPFPRTSARLTPELLRQAEKQIMAAFGRPQEIFFYPEAPYFDHGKAAMDWAEENITLTSARR